MLKDVARVGAPIALNVTDNIDPAEAQRIVVELDDRGWRIAVAEDAGLLSYRRCHARSSRYARPQMAPLYGPGIGRRRNSTRVGGFHRSCDVEQGCVRV
ncbi:MAG: hypothetical protein QOF69_74 [Solirubrobacteraceae bacterium]|jgi:hypothetical protein|nr:hypothetical protein [Solirubrobacteraceae bacterium]